MNGPQMRGSVAEVFLELSLIFPHKTRSQVLFYSKWRYFINDLVNEIIVCLVLGWYVDCIHDGG